VGDFKNDRGKIFAGKSPEKKKLLSFYKELVYVRNVSRSFMRGRE